MTPLSNEELARRLEAGADLLAAQGANHFRVQAYRRAAETIRGLAEPLAERLPREGVAGLRALPGIGSGIAGVLEQLLRTGRWGLLDQLDGDDPTLALRQVPGVGPALARRLVDELHVGSLEQLEAAARAGRLAALRGVGARRAAAMQAWLERALGRRAPHPPAREEPPLASLLDVDAEYRRRADELPRIAPRRHNPRGEAWLPVLHTDRGGWHFTALFSNTARAHELGRTRDWVVIYAYDAEHHESQCTVVTEHQGPLTGLRVVRGREAECVEHHTRRASQGG